MSADPRPPEATPPSRQQRLTRAARQHRHTALRHILHGISYGLGTTLVSLTAYWIQHHL